MLEKVFKKNGPKGKVKPRNLLKPVAIASGIVWVAAMGAVFALKDVSLAPADTHAKDEAHADDHEGPLANVPAAAHDGQGEHAEHGDRGKVARHAKHGKQDGHADAGHGDHSEAADAAAHPVEEESGHHEAEAHQTEAHGDAGHGDKHPGDKSHARKGQDKAHDGRDHHADQAHKSHAEGHAAEKAPAGHGDSQASDGHEDQVAIMGPTTEDERDALRQLAEIHASRGDLDKALKPLRKLMQAPGKDVPLLSLATEVFLGTGNYQEAFAAARKALRHASPGRVDLKVAAVMSQYRLGQMEPAMQAAQGYLKEHPKDLDLLTALGTMEIEMGPAHPHYGESLEKALHIKPKHVPALYQAGRKAQLEGDYKDAELAFRKVLKLDPRHAKAHGQLGTALYHLRREAEAREEFQAALELNPKDYNTWFNLGELHLAEAGKEENPRRIRELRAKAMACYLKAVEWNPDHAEAHYRAGVLLNGNGQYKEAIRHLEAARKVDSRHVPTLIQLAVAYENLKRPERAKAYLERAFELDPLDKIVQFKLKRMT